MTEKSPTKKFYANGKLMLTGEYVVLSGAEALALPLCKGQELIINKSVKRSALAWKTFVLGNHWFDAYFSLPELAIANTNDFPTAQVLRDIFLAARELNPNFPDPDFHYEISSKVNFDINWGFGSSSSLLVNIAKWAEIDPFDLHFKISNGSGYDIAAAISDAPILYKIQNGKPFFEDVDFSPGFSDNIYFAYLGKKKSSIEAVNQYKSQITENTSVIDEISSIGREITRVKLISDFSNLLRQHDEIISQVIKVKPIAQTRFYDFKGYVKSLGAWGGDFALFVTDYPKEYVLSYFRRKDIKTWFEYRSIVKSVSPGVNV